LTRISCGESCKAHQAQNVINAFAMASKQSTRFEPERNGAPLLADLPGWTLTPDEYQTAQQAKNDAYTNHMRSQRLRNLRVAERRGG